MALSLLAKPSPSRALLIARLHHASPSPSVMGAARLVNDSTLSQAFGLTRRHGVILRSGGMKQRCFCSSSGQGNGPSQRGVENAGPVNNSQAHQGINISNRTYPYQQQQAMHAASSNMTHSQQPAYSASSHQQPPSFAPGNQQPQQPGHAPAPPAGAYSTNSQQSGYVRAAGASPEAKTGVPPAHLSGDQNPSKPGFTTPNTSSSTSAGGAPPPPRTSAAAEVIDKYLGPSTLKLDKRDDKAPPPPPPPPPRRNYGPQGTQEKKSGKDLVAESAACAVIEKYLGPWPGFPPRDPKIDEYLDSLPENAACAAIDKYFGPYKPLFVFKKNEGEANNPPPPSRPPRNRMMSRARNRQWNASQQGASVDRPWTPPQQGPPVDASQGVQVPQGAGAPPSQGPPPSQPPSGTMASQPGAVSSQPGMNPNQMAPQQGASVMPPPGANVAPPHGGGFSPPGSNRS